MDMVPYPNKEVRSGHRSPNHPREPFPRSASFSGERGYPTKGGITERREDPALAADHGGSRGSFRHFDLEKAEAREAESHMSTNRYYSLMARENLVEDEDEIHEEWDADMPPNIEDYWANPNLMEAETCQGGNNLQIIEFRGGPSHPPGTNLSC